MHPLEPAAAFTGYTSYSYLEAGADYRPFRLAREIGRVPPYTAIDLDSAQTERVRRLLAPHTIAIVLIGAYVLVRALLFAIGRR